MTKASSDRLDRIEQILHSSTQLLGELAQNQSHQLGKTQTLLGSVQTLADTVQNLAGAVQSLVAASSHHAARLARQDALIERLDTIIERMVYREGRNRDANPPQS